jgi:hypothetical protein
MSKEEARQQIAEIVEKYRSQAESYGGADFNETAVRSEFINPFFKALGWDVDNTSGISELYREVHQELRLSSDENNKEGSDKKKPDYSFRLAGSSTPLFYVEAKKPSVHLNTDHYPAFQIRSYCWNSDTPIGIVTNFKEFAVYNGKARPDIKHKPSIARIHYLTYKDYLDNEVSFPGFRDGFDFLWNTFSREGVLKGGFNKYIETLPKLKGCLSVDRDFLQLMDDWRLRLAKTIVRNNPNINEDELNFVVHRTINRIVFFRIAEDRGLEPQDAMQNTTKQGNCYKNLFKLFDRAEDKYNSGLFDFEKDKISKKVTIDDLTIKKIVKDLYFPNPYNFVQIPIEILGSSYEHLLGKVVRLSPSRNVRVEEKPEIREAGGVYYTPQYIVNDIVKNTVGKLCEGKTPKEVEKIKIVDPACGSGSFLLGAYQYLLDWHTNYYRINNYENGNRKPKGLKTDKLTPDYLLTATEKKRILLNNIFGVDIDVLAVETTKLSLLIRCMQDETLVSIENTQKLFHERVLPHIDGNIRDGNSIVDVDFYENNLDFSEERKIKPFSWNHAFPIVFKQGGFDAVIGNPPWVSLNGKFGNDILDAKAQQYLIAKYQGNTYMPNLYEYFVHRGLTLINKAGLFSFIVPDRLGFNKQFVLLRKKIVSNFQIEYLLYKTPFPGTHADTLIFRFTQKIGKAENTSFTVGEYQSDRQTKTIKEYQDDPDCRFAYEANDRVSHILRKIFANPKCQALGIITETTSGVGAKISEITPKRKNQKQVAIIRGRSINKYSSINPFFFEFKKENITGRTVDRKKLGCKEKILLRKTGYPIYVTYDESGTYPEQSLYFIFNSKTDNSLKYITGLLNSKLFQFVYLNRLVTNKNTTPQLKKVDLDIFPVYLCYEYDKDKHNLIVRMVNELLQLYNEKNETLLSTNLYRIEEKIAYCEDKIDQLVYELYGLTEEEIAVIEGI